VLLYFFHEGPSWLLLVHLCARQGNHSVGLTDSILTRLGFHTGMCPFSGLQARRLPKPKLWKLAFIKRTKSTPTYPEGNRSAKGTVAFSIFDLPCKTAAFLGWARTWFYQRFTNSQSTCPIFSGACWAQVEHGSGTGRAQVEHGSGHCFGFFLANIDVKVGGRFQFEMFLPSLQKVWLSLRSDLL
jgi:hypothetical protein